MLDFIKKIGIVVLAVFIGAVVFIEAANVSVQTTRIGKADVTLVTVNGTQMEVYRTYVR